MYVENRFALAVVLCASFVCCGCASVMSPGNSQASRRADEHAAWWASVKPKTQYVPNRGYFLPETGRYYDSAGHPLAEDGTVQTAPRDEVAPEGEPFSIKDLSPSKIDERFKNVVGLGRDTQLARQYFQEGEQAFQQALDAPAADRRAGFARAAKSYSRASKRWSDSVLEEDSLFMLAECYFFQDRYAKAMTVLDRLIKKYPNTRHLDTVEARRFAVAQYWLELHEEDPKWLLAPNFTDRRRPRFDTFGNALRQFDQVRLEDPTGKLADDATMAAAIAAFEAEKYDRADQFFTDLRKSFPNSRHQYSAHLQGLKCKMHLYQGPDYDGTSLAEAGRLVEQINRQFPRETAEDRELLDGVAKRVRLLGAERDWHVAQYFDNRGEFGAARIYYQYVIKEFPKTNLADLAKARLVEVEGEPDHPPQRLAWIAKAFPKEERVVPLIATSPSSGKLR